MPWSGKSFAQRHNHSLHGAKADHAARIANAILRSGASEGTAIATASKWAKNHATGGGIAALAMGGTAPLGDPYREPNYDADPDLTWDEHLRSHARKPHGLPIDREGERGVEEFNDRIPLRQRMPVTEPQQVASGGRTSETIDRYFRYPSNKRQDPKALDYGGSVGPSEPDPISGGIAPTAMNRSPLIQGQYQRFAGLPEEKLQELSVRLPPNSQQGQMVRRALSLKHMNPAAPAPTNPAPIPSLGIAGGGYEHGGDIAHKEGGGELGVSLGMASPWWTRREASSDASMATGYLHGSTPGRADHITTAAPGGSYVIPADVVSGLGEGNSLAGAKAIERMLATGPWGTQLPRSRGHLGVHAPRPILAEAKGGGVHEGETGKPVPVKLSHGEYVVDASAVERIGRHILGPRASRKMAMKAAHDTLDKVVVLLRKQIIEKMKKLPGPARD